MNGRLIYVMGPSGSGKDSLLRQARDTLAQQPGGLARVCFAHRYITRPVGMDAENHIALSAAEFQARCRAGLFALHWHSHGQDYGIGLEIEQWLARGFTVVVNGSRAHLDVARRRYAALTAVLVSVSPETQRRRLLARGRESVAAIEARLARTMSLDGGTEAGAWLIDNEGPLIEATQQLLRLVAPAEHPMSALPTA
ncbi:MAG: phosphonate metabolism protein/1,5-bisphosphokinase (PRPP-forming) PhnN [Inhella sp.]|uniref:phosphonate metabolism protein/1,5-bisphosphokinase (PRPP-forming) PhnN n=1 Tax=Inhella sp. TaxID=1921806 RepID=UPI0022CC5F29|nr:phosphonate metabolism protein/1,5-bisphosphokinase (PRPP-forming) PhnN [Inhella sp.]MCZ8234292.1 phosphonate metabolism protein/1,5-bisphosphokinase (PRPP-forming) PhnN [Inhella sp.]